MSYATAVGTGAHRLRPPTRLTRALIAPDLDLDARLLRWAFGTPRYCPDGTQRAHRGSPRVAAP